MKVLVIIGSLRKKNTYETVKKIEKYHNKYAETVYEYIFLKDLNLKQCTGCFICISHGESKCPLKDDRDLIVNKIERSDGVILASPNYIMNVPWIMKNFIDRFSYIMHRPRFFNQYFMILITSGSYMGAKKASKSLSVMASGGKIISKLEVFNSPGMNQKKIIRQEKIIIKKTKAFYKQLTKKVHHCPSFGFLVWFSAFKTLSNVNKLHFPADFSYFKEKNYFINIRLNFFQRLSIKMLTILFKNLSRIGFV